jgi:hypothetical protein
MRSEERSLASAAGGARFGFEQKNGVTAVCNSTVDINVQKVPVIDIVQRACENAAMVPGKMIVRFRLCRSILEDACCMAWPVLGKAATRTEATSVPAVS